MSNQEKADATERPRNRLSGASLLQPVAHEKAIAPPRDRWGCAVFVLACLGLTWEPSREGAINWCCPHPLLSTWVRVPWAVPGVGGQPASRSCFHRACSISAAWEGAFQGHLQPFHGQDSSRISHPLWEWWGGGGEQDKAYSVLGEG